VKKPKTIYYHIRLAMGLLLLKDMSVTHICLPYVTQFWKTIDVHKFFKFHFFISSLSTETDEWAGQVTAFHHGDTALDS